MTERKCLVFSFADIEVREREFCIVRNGELFAVEPKAFRVLLFLLRNPHKLITKDELLDAVWNDIAVSENSLTRTIALLRRLLADDIHEPRFIATIPTVGYRFLCDVKVTEDGVIRSVDDQRRPPTIETRIPQKTQEQPLVDRRKMPAYMLLVGLCALAISIPTAMFLLSRAVSKPRLGATEQRVTSNSPDAPVAFAVISPDGKYLAYADPTGLYLRVIASGETRHWDVPKDFIAYPTSWFPDGTHLLVARFDAPTPSLWKLSLLGATPRKLIDNAGPGSVSPDGTRIAFVKFLPNSENELWVMGADGSNPRKIAAASQAEGPAHLGRSILSPSWSPDSRRIACIEHHWGASLAPLTDLSSMWTRDADGGDLQVILRDTLLGSALSWAPDGRILYSSRANTAGERADEEARSIRVDERTGKTTGQPQLVTGGVGTIGGISITSDGKRLVLWRKNIQEQAFISEFDASTRKWKTPRRLTLDANGNMATAWMSDSRTVLFVSNRNGTWTLFKQALDETTADVLVEGHSIYLPRLSADGSQVLYLSQTDPADPSVPISLMRLPVASGPSQVVLRDIGLGNYQCARLPSTLCIVSKFEKDYVIFFSFDPERGIGRELLKIRGGVHDWSLSPDGRSLADFPHGHSIHFLSVENGAAREDKTVTLNEWLVDNGDWNADGSGLLIPSITPAGMPVILEVNRAGKASVVLEGAANTPFEFMVQAPDGHHGILGAIVPGDNNAWVVDNF
jgi:DNA-binding winged helix-turn-helix (wHTH) protein/Tol biopolymer transport system component